MPSAKILRRIRLGCTKGTRVRSVRSTATPSSKQETHDVPQAAADDTCTRGRTCSPLLALGDDSLITILSFASYGPYEDSHDTRTPASTASTSDHHRLYSEYMDVIAVKTPPSNSPAYFFSKKRHKPRSRLQQRSFGTLTHVLPLVSKRFCGLCNESDVLWSQAMVRLAAFDPNGWKLALECYESGIEEEQDERKEEQDASVSHLEAEVEGYKRNEIATGCASLDQPNDDNEILSLVSKACVNFHSTLHASATEHNERDSTAKLLFKCLSKEAQPIMFEGPVFLMRTGQSLKLGREINLHLFEPRYRLLIREAMRGRTSREKRGIEIDDEGGKKPRPRFLFSFGVTLPLVSGDPAAIVELTRCRIFDDGRADVTIVPVRHARLSRIWERDGGHGLIEAEALAVPRIRQRGISSRGRPDQVVTGPAFCMPRSAPPELGIEFGLHLFPLQQIVMLFRLTNGRSEQYRRGVPIPDIESALGGTKQLHVPRGRFIYAYGPRRLQIGEDALVVELRRCRIKADRTADVTVIPVQLGTIVNVDTLSLEAPEVTVKVRTSLESI